MPAKKVARAQERRRIVNRRVRSSMRTAVKKAVRALNTNSESAGSTVLTAVSKLGPRRLKGPHPPQRRRAEQVPPHEAPQRGHRRRVTGACPLS